MFGLTNKNLLYLPTYEKCKEQWEKGFPVRGWDPTWREMKIKKDATKRVVKINDGEAYACEYHGTPLVTHYHDGSMRLQCHDSQSSVLFADYCVPRGVSPIGHKGEMFWGINTAYGVHYVRPAHRFLTMRQVGLTDWEYEGAATESEVVTDRAKAQTLRAQFKDCAAWMKVVVRLRGETWRAKPHHYRRHTICTDLLSDPKNRDLWFEALELYGQWPNLYNALKREAKAVKTVPCPPTRLPRKSI